MTAFYKKLLKTLLVMNKVVERSSPASIPVLMYHGVVPDDFPIDSWTLLKESEFRLQMDILKACYDITTIDEAFKSFGEKNQGKPKAVVTFDDGYRNLYYSAYPILRKYKIPATIFLVTDYSNRNKLFWFDKIILAMQKFKSLNTDKADIRHACVSPDRVNKDRWERKQHILEYLKQFCDSDRELISERMFSKLQIGESTLESLYVLKAEQIRNMTNSELIEFGSHTHNHKLLNQQHAGQAEDSIHSSIKVLNQLTGNNCRHFAYPNGDYTSETISVLKKLGFLAAFTTREGRWNYWDNRFEIPRISVGSYDSPLEFVLKISGFHSRLKNLKRFIKK